jgi:endoglycosylceramidase
VQRRLPGCADARSTQACPTRPYPRAVPGRLTSIDASPCGPGPLTVTGTTSVQSTADLWFPTDSTTEPVVTGDGIDGVTAVAQDGGWRLFVRVSGSYRISVA